VAQPPAIKATVSAGDPVRVSVAGDPGVEQLGQHGAMGPPAMILAARSPIAGVHSVLGST
jgi:hypothetical protein